MLGVDFQSRREDTDLFKDLDDIIVNGAYALARLLEINARPMRGFLIDATYINEIADRSEDERARRKGLYIG